MQHAGIVIDDSYGAHDDTIIGCLQLSARQETQSRIRYEPRSNSFQHAACKQQFCTDVLLALCKIRPCGKGAQIVVTANREISGLHFNPQLRPHVLEHDGDGLDDQLTGVRLAIDDDLVLGLF